MRRSCTEALVPFGRGRWGASLAACIALVPLVGGCALFGSSGAEPIRELTVGDCLYAPSAHGDSAKVVDCEHPHSGQVVGVYQPEGGPYPGADILASEAQAYCAEAFARFVGSDPLTSVLDLFPLLPTQGGWDEGDTSVVCVASTFDDLKVRQTFKESHR